MAATDSELSIMLSKVPATKRADVTEILDLAKMEASLLKGSKSAQSLIELYILARWIQTAELEAPDWVNTQMSARHVADATITELRTRGDGSVADAVRQKLESLELLGLTAPTAR